jgi:hypothetical protein
VVPHALAGLYAPVVAQRIGSRGIGNLAALTPERGSPSGEWTQHHQMSINGRFDAITLADLYALADTQGIPRFRQVTDEVLAAVRAWPDFAHQAGVDGRTVGHIHDQMSEHSLS